MTIDEIRARFRSFPEDVKAGVAEEVDVWRGTQPKDFRSRFARAIENMPESMLQEWMTAGMKRGDSGVMGKILDALEFITQQGQEKKTVFMFLNYRYKDDSVGEALLRGPDHYEQGWKDMWRERFRQRTRLEDLIKWCEQTIEWATHLLSSEQSSQKKSAASSRESGSTTTQNTSPVA